MSYKGERDTRRESWWTHVFHNVDHHVVLDQFLAILPVGDGGRRGTLLGHV
jgi:hypothetical protein